MSGGGGYRLIVWGLSVLDGETKNILREFLRQGQVDRAAALLLRDGHERQAAVVLRGAGRLHEAHRVFLQAGLWEEATRCLLELGDYRAAAGVTKDAGFQERAEEILRSAGDYIALSRMLIERGAVDEAREVLDRITASNAEYVHALALRGHLAQMRGDWREVFVNYSCALDIAGLDLRTARLAMRAAEAAANAGEFQATEAYVRELEEKGLLKGELRAAADRLLGLAQGSGEAAKRPASTDPSSFGGSEADPARQDAEAGDDILDLEPTVTGRHGGTCGRPQLPEAETQRAAPRPPSIAGGLKGLPSHPFYRFLRKIGAGGMGVVYEARDERDGQRLVVKLLRSKSLNTESARDMFLHEAMLLSFLSHPNIVSVFDYGHIDVYPFLAMEYVEGHDLTQLLKGSDQRRLGLPLVVAITTQVAAALDHAHVQGIAHRDIKLSNVMLAPGNVVKLLDFGLAKAVSTAMEVTDDLMGTPPYMAPELIQGLEHDHRVDIYALGVMLYRLLTGAYPFSGKDVLKQHVRVIPQDPLMLNRNLPLELGGVILRCLEKNPANRFETAGAVAKGVAAAAGLPGN